MASYNEMRRVYDECLTYLRQIVVHSHGGPSPQIPGIPLEGYPLLAGAAGRDMSVEMAKALVPFIAEEKRWRAWETSVQQKRPKDALEQHLTYTANLLAAYVARINYTLENSES